MVDSKRMIKGITFVHAAGTPAVYDTLHRFFSAVGLEPGRSWETDTSRGAPFLAPVGSFELLDGMAHLPAASFPAQVLIEVTAIDDVHRAAKQWLEQAAGAEEAAKRITNVSPTTWKSLAFTIEPVPGLPFAFWQWEDPLRGKPLAIEGDLSAAGMRFAIVVSRWNAVITDRLLQGALDGLLRSGAARPAVPPCTTPLFAVGVQSRSSPSCSPAVPSRARCRIPR